MNLNLIAVHWCSQYEFQRHVNESEGCHYWTEIKIILSERERETVPSLQIKLKGTCCSNFQDHIFILLFFHQSYKDTLALALYRFKSRKKLLETKCLKKCQLLGFAYTGLII